MTSLLSRLLLALSVIVAAPAVYVASFVLLERSIWHRDAQAFHGANVVTGMFFVVAWIAVWRGQVTWTRTRVHLTLLAVFACMGIGAVMGFLIAASAGQDEPGIIVGGVFWGVTWLPCTAVIWRETASERARRLRGLCHGAVACPRCGYNMTGLREARCPECGTQYTLDELLAHLQEQAADFTDH